MLDVNLEKTTEDFKMEPGFGTCSSCGKRTLGKSNTLCSRCGGASVAFGCEAAAVAKDAFPKRVRPCPGRYLPNGDFITVSGRKIKDFKETT